MMERRSRRDFLALRRGVVLFVVIFVVIILAVLVVQFHFLSRQSQSVAFQLERREVAVRIAEMALEEGFILFRGLASSPATAEGKWLVDRSTNRLSIPVPSTAAFAKTQGRQGDAPTVDFDVGFVDDEFRDFSRNGAKMYGKEAVGSVELRARFWFKADKTLTPSCEAIRVHDYKVVSIRTARNNGGERNEYAQNFPLDYALFVRRGCSEFESEKGGSLNNSKKRLVIDQSGLSADRRGKVLVGETGVSKGKSVFLNVHAKFADTTGLVPAATQTEIVIPSTDLPTLFPRVFNALTQAGVQPSQYASLEGVFRIRHVPLVRDSYSTNDEKMEQNALDILAKQADDPEKNVEPGIEILGADLTAMKEVSADTVLEGDVRQRFLRVVDFQVRDKSNTFSPNMVQQLNGSGCLSIDYQTLPTDQDQKDFYQGLKTIATQKSIDIFSRFISSYPYKAGCSGNPQPGFPEYYFRSLMGQRIDVGTTGTDGVQPFYHINLFGRRWPDQASMQAASEGVYDPDTGTLKLHGIYQIYDGDLNLGSPGKTLTISGKGVLIAKGNISIQGNIAKGSSTDIVVIFSRTGTITVDADKVQAALVALGGGTGQVIFRRSTELYGALVAERLALSRWSDGTVTVRYDPLFKDSGQQNDIYVSTISPVVSYFRTSENKP